MRRSIGIPFALSAIIFWPSPCQATTDEPVDAGQVRQIIEQNRKLQDVVADQQRVIELLRERVSALEKSGNQERIELNDLQRRVGTPAPEAQPAAPPVPAPAEEAPAQPAMQIGHEGAVHISGEMGAAFFLSGADGAFPNGEFRIDEARLFVEAPVWKDVYFYSELNVVTREADDQNIHPGELYVDMENVSAAWGADRVLNLRAGRLYVPFGEEYQYRYVVDNPLISHSASDIWGYDEGVEMYGQMDRFSYALAVQDGGISSLNTAHKDKSVAARLSYDPTDWMHLSASAMRTGQLSPTGDSLSALWFANGFFRSLGPPSRTSNFDANLLEVDAGTHWKGGGLKLAGGLVRFGDDYSGANDTRHMDYFYVETTQHLTKSLFGAVRFSGIEVPGGYPLAGQATLGEYFFGDELTTNLERLSFGLGYQFASPFLIKIEYSAEWGRTTSGDRRDSEDLFSTEVGIKF